MNFSERIPHVVDARRFALFQPDFDHIESPWQLAGAEALEPGVGAALDERLLWFVHRIERADFRVLAAGFHFHKEQEFSIAGDTVHLAAAPTLEVPGENPAAMRAEKIGGGLFAVFADPFSAARRAVRLRQAAGRVEPPAETSDDGGDKGRVSEALQDAPWCHIPDAGQSRIAETRGRARA